MFALYLYLTASVYLWVLFADDEDNEKWLYILGWPVLVPIMMLRELWYIMTGRSPP